MPDDRPLPHGVLNPPEPDRWRLRRREPPPALADAVAWLWAVGWDLEGRPDHEQSTLPHPSAHVVVEDGAAVVHGPTSGRFTRVLSGRGRVVAARFRAGGLAAFGPPVVMAELVDRRVPATEVVPGWGEELVAAVDRIDDLDNLDDLDGAMARLAAGLEAGLSTRSGPRGGSAPGSHPASGLRTAVRPAGAPEADAIVDRIAEDRTIRSVGDVAAATGHHRRRVERLLAAHVGLGPKAVIRRYRLQDAAAAAQSGDRVDWAALAAELGYFDQAHLVRHFTEVIGCPPAAYARRIG
ncbi:MAG: helix-turn-helix transcriptional regulator [Actinomycetota bacterium]